MTQKLLGKIVKTIQYPSEEKLDDDLIGGPKEPANDWLKVIKVGDHLKQGKSVEEIVYIDRQDGYAGKPYIFMTSFMEEVLCIIRDSYGNMRRFFRGPSGIGETVTLAAAADYATSMEYFVIYIPKPGIIYKKFVDDKKRLGVDGTLAKNIIQLIHDEMDDDTWTKFMKCPKKSFVGDNASE